MTDLPIDAIKPALFAALDDGVNRFVVAAPTGSGKSTRLPQMLAQKIDGAIYILQPRRVAARMLAKRVAYEMGASVGKEVGWQIRFEKNYTPQTKIVFLTEGVLARKLLSKGGLDGVGAIIFDEFHERNIYADISLALALKLQNSARPDIKIAVCSASVDSESLMAYLGANARKLECGCRLYPIEINYAPPRASEDVWDAAAREFARLAADGEDGNFLIFMPGAYEISRTLRAISQHGAARHFDVCALHGDLPADRQDAVLSPSKKRKVIVSTNIAETSLTIDGVRFVIDGGLARVARYDASRGVNTLLTERISLAGALQRAGRAGRTAAGYVSRLWRQTDEMSFEKFTAPEIKRLSLSQIMLWLAAAGLTLENAGLLEPPAPEAAADARAVLTGLGALDAEGKITPLGRTMAKLPTEPRYAKLLIEGARLKCLDEACHVAALTEAGRVFLGLEDAFRQSELDDMLGDACSELEELAKLCMLARLNRFDEGFCRTFGIHMANARQVCAYAADFKRIASRLNFDDEEGCASLDEEPALASGSENWRNVSKAVLSAFPDHLCKRLNAGTLACDIAGGRRGELRKESRKYSADVFCAISLREQSASGRVSIMASLTIPVLLEDIKEMFPAEFDAADRVDFDDVHKCVVNKRAVYFRGLELFNSRASSVPEAAAAAILAEHIMKGKLVLKRWDEDVENFVRRVNFVSKYAPETGLSFIDEDFKRMIFEQACCGFNSYAQVRDMDILKALKACYSREELSLLEYMTPECVSFPNRKKPCLINYDVATGRAVLSAWFKDLLGFDSSKLKVLGGKIPVTYEVLAPNGRPVQTTQNLPEFWKTSWLQISKELKTRYPRHFK